MKKYLLLVFLIPLFLMAMAKSNLNPVGLVSTVYAGHCEGDENADNRANNQCSTSRYCDGNTVYSDNADGGHSGVEVCSNGCENGACKSSSGGGNQGATCSNGTKKVGEKWPECHGCDEGNVVCTGQDQYGWESVRNPSPNCGATCGTRATTPPSNGKISCKSTFTPSELGINDSRVCDRLHQYVAVDNCGKRCDTKADCPQNTDQSNFINAGTSNWCYEFRDDDGNPNNNNRCLQLRYKGNGTETSCVAGETGGGACSGNACNNCVLNTRKDILPFYKSNGWDTSCNNQTNVVNDWCRIDANGCRDIKANQCATSCGGSTGVTFPSSTLSVSSTSVQVGQQLTVNASATPSNGSSIQSIEFYFAAPQTLIGSCSSSSCSKTWTPTSAGTYQVYLDVYDSGGRKCSNNPNYTRYTTTDPNGWARCGASAATVTVGSATTAPTAAPTTPPAKTVSFRIAENPTDLNTAAWQAYTAEGMIIPYDFKTTGQKFIFAQFKDSNGNVTTSTNCPTCQAQIKVLDEPPTIASCSLGFEGNNTVLTLTGQRFGATKGVVKSSETDLQIRSWKSDNVVVVWQNAPVGQAMPITLTNIDDQTADGRCSAISQLALGAKVFCRAPSNHQTSNVDLVLAEAFTGGKKFKQKVTIDKDGFVQGLTQKLEAGKDYLLSLKAPRSLRRTVKFTAQEGTTNLPNFILPVGDIFPADGGDGEINSLDKAELNRQWIIAVNATGRSGDFNQDGRVNSIDWACMRYDFGQKDNVEPVPGESQKAAFCGGFADIKCSPGFNCLLESQEPDAGGTCVACTKRPACLDEKPACKLPEPAGGWCSATPASNGNSV